MQQWVFTARRVRGAAVIAALYVQTDGHYFGLPDVDPWDVKRDARNYAGPWPVVAHPPCGRWCRLAGLVQARYGYRKGDDGGTFAAALAAVRKWGGVLEHPAWSDAWPAHDLPTPTKGGWSRTLAGDWVCEVEQHAYGHAARKATWLLYHGATPPPSMRWVYNARGTAVISGCANRGVLPDRPRLWAKAASRTPVAFRDVLIQIAKGVLR